VYGHEVEDSSQHFVRKVWRRKDGMQSTSEAMKKHIKESVGVLDDNVVANRVHQYVVAYLGTNPIQGEKKVPNEERKEAHERDLTSLQSP
jgi:hypothetical protein